MVKDVICIVLISSALAFIQPRETDIKVSFGNDPAGNNSAVILPSRQTSYNRSYSDGAGFPSPALAQAWQPGYQPLRLVNNNLPVKNSNNPYYSASTGNQYSSWQLVP